MTAPASLAGDAVGGGEHLHHARPALYLPARPLLHVVGAQALAVRRREVEAGQRVRLGLLQHRRRPRAAPLRHCARRAAHCRHGGGAAAAERLRDDPARTAPEPPGAGPAHAVPHQADGAAPPRGALEDLAEGADEARAGVRDDEPRPGDAAAADLPEEGQPRAVRLGVHRVDAQGAPPAARVAADGGVLMFTKNWSSWSRFSEHRGHE